MADTPATVDVAEQLVPVRRALLSVSDKAGLAPFAAALHHEFGVELISTGGTAKFLRDAGLPVTDVSAVTGFPEMMDGRVKTLHPNVHGGLLGLRDHADHLAAMKAHGIRPIDLVCINLYPFQQTIERPDVTFDEAIENIDIGGPAMIRSAAKNHAWVVVVTSPDRYETVLGDLRKHGGRSCAKLRLKQSQAAFGHTADYDGRIAKYLAGYTMPGSPAETDRQLQPAGGPGKHVAGLQAGAIGTAAATTRPQDGSGRASDGELAIYRAEQWAADIRVMADGAVSSADFLTSLLNLSLGVADGTEACVFRPGLNGELTLVAFRRSQRPMLVAKESDATVLTPVAAQALASNIDTASRVGGEVVGAQKPSAYGIVTHLRQAERTEFVMVTVARCTDDRTANDLLIAVQMLAGAYGRFAAREMADIKPPMASAVPPPADPPPPMTSAALLTLTLHKKQDLRYGENPHQRAALYVGAKPREASVAFATQHHGKELSYINLLDADGALACVKEFAGPAACIVKHTTPCGCATADDLAAAFRRAYAGDPLAAFGGIVAVNKPVDLAAAEAITSIDKLLEVIVAPYYAEDALDLLRSRWKNVRLLEVGPIVQGSDAANPARRDATEVSLHKITGGYLVQERDLLGLDESTWRVASRRQPTAAEMSDLRFAWLVCKHVKSNAIVVCKDGMLLGAGAGQMDRPSAARLAVSKAGDRIAGAVAASDAFFPFPDGPALLLAAGVTAVIHPGGSLKDQDTIDLVDRQGAALVLTGQRHFKH